MYQAFFVWVFFWWRGGGACFNTRKRIKMIYTNITFNSCNALTRLKNQILLLIAYILPYKVLLVFKHCFYQRLAKTMLANKTLKRFFSLHLPVYVTD